MQAEVDKSTDTAHKFPDGTSDVVKGWQKSFADAYANANKLAAVAGNLPGAARVSAFPASATSTIYTSH